MYAHESLLDICPQVFHSFLLKTLIHIGYVCERQTRMANKFVFETESKIGTKYENSPFYRGTKLWNLLSSDIQFSENRWVFKAKIAKMYKTYRPL